MRTTITLDDTLLARAREYLGPLETSAIVREAMNALVQREAGRRLMALGGSAPDFPDPPPRRRFDPDPEWS